MEVLEQGGEVVFLRKLKEGPAAESYGLHVARLAGLADPLLKRAAQIMAKIRERDTGIGVRLPVDKAEKGEPPVPETEKAGRLLAELASLTPDSMTPLGALNLISRWKKEYEAFSIRPAYTRSRKDKDLPRAEPGLFDLR
jgi:DNA mismatch repair protein MutS